MNAEHRVRAAIWLTKPQGAFVSKNGVVRFTRFEGESRVFSGAENSKCMCLPCRAVQSFLAAVLPQQCHHDFSAGFASGFVLIPAVPHIERIVQWCIAAFVLRIDVGFVD